MEMKHPDGKLTEWDMHTEILYQCDMAHDDIDDFDRTNSQ